MHITPPDPNNPPRLTRDPGSVGRGCLLSTALAVCSAFVTAMLASILHSFAVLTAVVLVVQWAVTVACVRQFRQDGQDSTAIGFIIGACIATLISTACSALVTSYPG